jgi:hypothetical protein
MAPGHQDRDQRLRGIANTVFARYPQVREAREDIIHDVWVKLEEIYRAETEYGRRYVRKMVKHAVIDWFRERGFEVPADLEDPEDANEEDAEPGNVRPWRDKSRRGDPPPCVVEAQLKLRYAQGHSEGFVLLGHAFWSALGWQPAQIVETLGELTLGQAAQTFLERYREDEEASLVPKGRLPVVLKDLYAIPQSPEAGIPLNASWQVVHQLEEWVSDPDIATKSANRRLVRVLRDALRLSWPQIIGRGGDTLEEIAVWFEGEYARRNNVSRDEVHGQFGEMLDCGKVARRRLNEYWSAARTVTHWCNDVEKKIETRCNQQERRGLENIFRAAPWPCKSLVFTENFILKSGYDNIANAFNQLTMGATADLLATRYAAGRKKEEKAVRSWLAPLRDQIGLAAGMRWSELVERDRRPGEKTSIVISRWRDDVFRAVSPLFGCHDKDTVLFAWDAGFL